MKKHLLFLLISCVLLGCKQIPIWPTAENSSTWVGIYEGTFFCADCDLVSTRLTLAPDLTYTLEDRYIKNSKVVLTNKYQGSFSLKKRMAAC